MYQVQLGGVCRFYAFNR